MKEGVGTVNKTKTTDCFSLTRCVTGAAWATARTKQSATGMMTQSATATCRLTTTTCRAAARETGRARGCRMARTRRATWTECCAGGGGRATCCDCGWRRRRRRRRRTMTIAASAAAAAPHCSHCCLTTTAAYASLCPWTATATVARGGRGPGRLAAWARPGSAGRAGGRWRWGGVCRRQQRLCTQKSSGLSPSTFGTPRRRACRRRRRRRRRGRSGPRRARRRAPSPTPRGQPFWWLVRIRGSGVGGRGPLGGRRGGAEKSLNWE